MTSRGGLSAPEAYVLLSLPRYDVDKALKLGFLALIAQGLVRMESVERRVMLRKLHLIHLLSKPDAPDDLPPIAASLMRVVRAAEPTGSMFHVVAQSRREYGRSLNGFVKDYVMPSLVGRGLAEERPARLLGLFPTTRFVRTAAGDVERIRLENAMREAREIPRFLDRDPAQAAALAVALGGAILLVNELQPYYQQLAAAIRPGGSGGDVPVGDGSFDAGGFDVGGFDFGGVDFSAVDFSGIDFSGFDSGFSDAGGDGGGSGGC